MVSWKRAIHAGSVTYKSTRPSSLRVLPIRPTLGANKNGIAENITKRHAGSVTYELFEFVLVE
jgi:hypothetical protein